jgi:hypothetical protein
MGKRRNARADAFPRLHRPPTDLTENSSWHLANDGALTWRERHVLFNLQRQALQYFLDNQAPCGLFLDRQANHGQTRFHGECSTATSGMGVIALALAAAEPYLLLTLDDAAARICSCLSSALCLLPHDHGMMPHFVDSTTGRVEGFDAISTIDSSWLLAGALWSGAFLRHKQIQQLAQQLYDRVHWDYWTAPEAVDARGLLRHGKDHDGSFLTCSWDRLNGETVFMYVLAAGAAAERSIDPTVWQALEPSYGTVAGLRFNSSDLGLFVFQYSVDLLDLDRWHLPHGFDLWTEARTATTANYLACRQAASRFKTYERFWGLSAGDGPGDLSSYDAYRCYTPGGPVDGTAHLTAALGGVAHAPAAVLENIIQAEGERRLRPRGRYGFSSINVDRDWVGRDMIGIDAGAAILALDNYLMNGRIRDTFHKLPCVQEGLRRLSFKYQSPQPRRRSGTGSPAIPQQICHPYMTDRKQSAL